MLFHDSVLLARRGGSMTRCYFGRDMIQSETSSSSNFSIRVVRAYPLIKVRQTVPCRAIRGNSISVNSTLPPLSHGHGHGDGHSDSRGDSRDAGHGSGVVRCSYCYYYYYYLYYHYCYDCYHCYYY